MTREQIASIFERRRAAFDRQDAAALAADYTRDCTIDSPSGGTHHGPAEAERVLANVFDALDVTLHRESVIIDGDSVAEVVSIEEDLADPPLRAMDQLAAKRSVFFPLPLRRYFSCGAFLRESRWRHHKLCFPATTKPWRRMPTTAKCADPDACSLLPADHRNVKRMFKEYETLPSSKAAARPRRSATAPTRSAWS